MGTQINKGNNFEFRCYKKQQFTSKTNNNLIFRNFYLKQKNNK